MDFVFKIGYGLEIFQKKYDRDYVRKAIGGQWKTYPKSEFTENSTDTFGEIVARAFYDAGDILIGIEFSALKAKFWINNYQFLGKTIGQVKSRLSIMEIDFEGEEDETGINILNNAVRFYAPEMDDLVDLAKIVSIYVCIETIDFKAKFISFNDEEKSTTQSMSGILLFPLTLKPSIPRIAILLFLQYSTSLIPSPTSNKGIPLHINVGVIVKSSTDTSTAISPMVQPTQDLFYWRLGQSLPCDHFLPHKNHP